MTNLDKIRTMPPEELGTFLSNLVAIEDCFECPIRDVCNERMVNPNNEAFHTCELSRFITGCNGSISRDTERRHDYRRK